MRALWPFIKLYRRYGWSMLFGILLALVTLLATLFLLSLSGWFLAATAFVGVAGLYTFNYMLPAAGVRGAAIIRTAARYAERLLSHNTTFKLLAYLRTLAFSKIMPLSERDLQQYQRADLLQRFISDIDHLDHCYLRLISPILSAIFSAIIIYAVLAYFDITLATTLFVIIMLTTLIMPVIFYRAGKDVGANITQQQSTYRQQSIQFFQAQAELTLFNGLAQYRQQLDDTETKWLQSQQQQAKLSALALASLNLIIGLLILIICYLGANGIAGYASPIIALFIFTALSCAELLAPIPNAFLFLGQVIASATRITQLFNQQPTITFVEQGPALQREQLSVELKQLSFSYPIQIEPVLQAINLTIPAGQHVALIGKTGCGKSTLLKLLTRSWQPTEGTITFNGIEISQLDRDTLRSIMAVVPQTVDILNTTLRDNLQIANAAATDTEMSTVLQQVGLEKLLHDPAGLDLWLGESGRQLSGGERRRIGIARALLHQAPLILMDEPTESLDQQTEQQILALMREVYQHKTVLMVTHRLAETGYFDKIYRLEQHQLHLVAQP